MRLTRFCLLSCGALLGGVAASTASRADIIHLKNGNTIEGTVISGDHKEGEKVVVQIGDAGTITLRAGQIADVAADKEESKRDTGAKVGDYVAVRLSSGNTFYGDGTYFGRISPASDDRTLVLAIDDAGKIRIPKSHVASAVKIEAPAAAAAPAGDERTIKTTHVLFLKNGREIRGNLLKTDDDQIVKLLIGNLGILEFRLGEVEGVEERPGEIKLPEPPPVVEAPEHGEKPSQELREQLKREIRDDILRDLLDRAIEQKLDDTFGRERILESVLEKELLEGLSNGEILALQNQVRELSRQRTTNRVRAERHLKSEGSVALPFLQAVVHHPFDLTRRAVQRIVRDIGDLRGAPLAIESLNDADKFVRELAYAALQRLLPDAGVAYHPKAKPARRAEAVEAYWSIWADILFEEAQAQLREKLARG